jgi:hypothetical protein
MAITPLGSLAGVFADLSRIMPAIVLQALPPAQPGTRAIPAIQSSPSRRGGNG